MSIQEFNNLITKNDKWIRGVINNFIMSTNFTVIRKSNVSDIYSSIYDYIYTKELYKRIETEDHFQPFIINVLTYSLKRNGSITYNKLKNKNIYIEDKFKDKLFANYIYNYEDKSNENDFTKILDEWSSYSTYNRNLLDLYVEGYSTSRKLAKKLNISHYSGNVILNKMKLEIELLTKTNKDYEVIHRYVNYLIKRKRKNKVMKGKMKKFRKHNSRFQERLEEVTKEAEEKEAEKEELENSTEQKVNVEDLTYGELYDLATSDEFGYKYKRKPKKAVLIEDIKNK